MTPWTIAHQAPQSLGFSRQEYCSGLPFPTPEDLPNPGIEPRSPTLHADSSPAELQGKPALMTNSSFAKNSSPKICKNYSYTGLNTEYFCLKIIICAIAWKQINM